jgi:RNA polymerase sigma-70 factor, ECF subfamily
MTKGAKSDEGQKLMLRVKQGDESAFESLVDLYRSQVVGMVYRYLGDAARAEDVAQEAFLRVYRARKSYKPLAQFKTWLFRIVYNLVVNEANARKRNAALSLERLRASEDGAFFVEDENAPIPEKELEHAELLAKVREAVLDLPENQRMALVMNKYRDMPYVEIAQAMGLSVEAVKSMLFRAREKVRNKLIRYMQVPL